MWKGISKLLFLTLTISRIRGLLAWPGNHLHPVQGLYVKPSIDGTTGDLYVAATEDHGVDAHWLTDQPINFLPSATETKVTKVPASLSSSFSKSSTPHEESVTTQKRAIITSPQIKYTYALPSTEGSPVTPYQYVAVPVAASQEATPPCSTNAVTPGYPQFSPYHYFYPQMMAAVANAVAPTTDASNENGSSSSPTQPSPYWPGYSYPYPYVMVDPAWLQSSASAPVTPETSTNE